MMLARYLVRPTGFVLIWIAVSGSVMFESLFAPKADPWPRWETHDPTSTRTIDHSGWTEFLKTRRELDTDGIARIDYAGVTPADRSRLSHYLDRLTAIPISHFARSEQFAYWVNLYNALTVATILDHYPVDSIRSIDISEGWLASGPWDAKLIAVEGVDLTLNDIEHRILRPIWRDPRIHYVVNCASVGCPNIPAVALTGSDLEEALNQAARDYINSPRGVSIAGDTATISSIYGWYQEDFGNSKPSVIRHLTRYADADLAHRLKLVDPYALDYAYDWDLNAAVP